MSKVSAYFTYCLFSFAEADCSAGTAGGLGMLTTDTEATHVTDTAMRSNFLQAFQIFTELVVQVVD